MTKPNLTNLLLSIITLFVIALILKLTESIIITILIAVLLAYVMDPLVALFRKIHFPLLIGVLVSAFIFISLFLGFGFVLYQSSLEFAGRFPVYQDKFLQMLNEMFAKIPISAGETIKTNILLELKKIPIGSIVLTAAGSIAGFISDFILVFLFSILFLFGKYGLTRKLLRSFPVPKGKKIALLLYRIDGGLRQYIGIKTLTSASVGIGTWICLLFFQVEFATILGFLTFVLNFIPYIGSVIAVAIPPLIALIQFGNITSPIWIMIILVIIQNIIGNFLEPKIVGNKLNLTITVVFFSLLFWGWLWGAPGILLAVPMTTSIKIILESIPEYKPYALLLEKAPKKRGPKK